MKTSSYLLRAVCLSLTFYSFYACVAVSGRSDIQQLNRIFRVKANQTLYAFDPKGRVVAKQLTRSADAVLYEREDTLYTEFETKTLPVSDDDPKTLDQSDASSVLFYHYNRRLDKLEEKSPYFKYQLTTFDIDVFTIPFKYRLEQEGIPGSLSTSANVGLYTGLRYDLGRYRNIYDRRNRRSDIKSFSFGVGTFVSINPAIVNEFTTNGRYLSEYEALGVNYGLATILGYKSITAGLALGFENLADRNNSLWIYRNKPWIGITVGLNVN